MGIGNCVGGSHLRVKVIEWEIPKGFDTHFLVIDGKKLEDSTAEPAQQRGKWYATLYKPSDIHHIENYSLAEIKKHFVSLSLACDFEWNKHIESIEIAFRDYEGEAIERVRFECMLDVEQWIYPYSVAQYVTSLKEEIAKAKGPISFYEGGGFENEYRFGFECQLTSLTASVKSEISRWIQIVKPLCDKVVEELLRSIQKDSLITFFSFPSPIKAACSQYLLYFIQFLEDLGIKADSEIKENAGHVLFSVTPKDGPAALDKIKEALEIYLDLPRNPAFNAAGREFLDMAVSQLTANVFFLKSQLALGQAMLETKNATIEALNFTVYQQRQLLTGSTKRASEEEKSKDSEPIVGDTVHLTKYEGKFLKVDLPTILRRLKRSFGIGEK